jgi:hypothetical protein
MLTRILLAVLYGIVTYVILMILASVLAVAELARFAFAISVIVGILAFLGAIPSRWWDRP